MVVVVVGRGAACQGVLTPVHVTSVFLTFLLFVEQAVRAVDGAVHRARSAAFALHY